MWLETRGRSHWQQISRSAGRFRPGNPNRWTLCRLMANRRNQPVPKGVREWTLKGMDIKRAGSQASAKGPSEWFTGTVRIDPLFQAPDPALVQGASVTFEPGARTAWHTHPLGQT